MSAVTADVHQPNSLGRKRFEAALQQLSGALPPPSIAPHPLANEEAYASALRDAWLAHPSLHPSGTGVGSERATRKQQQIESIVTLAALLADDFAAPRIVDFGGGSGALSLALAALLPRGAVTIIDVKKKSLAMAVERARAAGLANVATYEGDIFDFDSPFDVGVALHACGEASDLALLKSHAAGARFVVCPCCVGKVAVAGSERATRKRNNTTFNLTGENACRVAYPRSAAVAAVVGADAYGALAAAADFNEASQVEGPRGALRRLSKSWLEHDRLLAAREGGQCVTLTRLHPPSASPKNHVLFGWPAAAPPPPEVVRRLAAVADAADDADAALAQALGLGCAVCEAEDGEAAASRVTMDDALAASEWTADELADCAARLAAFAADEAAGDELSVPAHSARLRRLVHYAAERAGLLHWSEPKVAGARRTVRVARPD